MLSKNTIIVITFLWLYCSAVVAQDAFSAIDFHEDSIPVVVPNIERIKIATVVTQDIKVTKKLYHEWLNYQVVETGRLTELVANSWGLQRWQVSHMSCFNLKVGMMFI